MGVFDDKKFEQLDWMTQVTETIDSELNGLLARLPDEKTFNMASLLAVLDNSYSLSVSSGNLVRQLLRDIIPNVYGTIDYAEEQRLIKCFEFRGSDNLEINFETMEMKGELKLVKICTTIEDEDLQKMMGGAALETFYHQHYDESMNSRINEILELIEAPKESFRSRAARKKVRAARDRLKIIFTNNEWRIRDMGLATKIVGWCQQYIMHGTLSAHLNLCKIKVMTHSAMPIYSIEEEQ